MKSVFFLLLFNISSFFCIGQAAAAEFILVPEGTYGVGRENLKNNPSRLVHVKAFRISKYEITNSQFKAFIDATGYETTAERLHHAMVYRPGLEEFRWYRDTTANWHFPQGKSYYCADTLPNHPVTCVTLEDARAYCNWAGGRLPTLEEWEISSRAGTDKTYHWGKNPKKVSDYGNVWHGFNHLTIDSTDGFPFTAPVGSFLPNKWGLYDMAGNLFELCEGELPGDEKGVAHARGGSWWCSWNSCRYYNNIYIGKYKSIAAFSNIGFRVVIDND